jgi:type IV secretory pathway VirD2 relaxase
MRGARLIKGGEVDFKLRRHVAWLQRLSRISPPARRSRPRLFKGPERVYGRKSVLKAAYVRNWRPGRQWSGRMEAHARYMERNHSEERGHKELGFDATEDRVDITQTARNWALARDWLHWRLILAPEDAGRVDLRRHAREVMAQMEKDLDTRLKWVAIEHDNTEHHHVHILLRGVRQEIDEKTGRCKPLVMSRDYVSRSIREISERLMEQELGPRSEREYMIARGHGIEALRWTEIDRAIARKADLGIADYSHARWITSERTRARINQEMERLAFLEGLGLAQSLGDYRWELKPGWKEELRELQLQNDVIKTRARERSRQHEQAQQERELS